MFELQKEKIKVIMVYDIDTDIGIFLYHLTLWNLEGWQSPILRVYGFVKLIPKTESFAEHCSTF